MTDNDSPRDEYSFTMTTHGDGNIWNAALLALGRQWHRQMMHYAPEELHEIRKAIYALWRGKKPDAHTVEDEAVCDAITAGLEEP